MKSTTVHRLLSGLACCFVLSLLTHLNVSAAEKKSASFATKKTCFIENKGQVTDQYGQVRHDIDYMLRGSGFNIYVSNSQLHYQFTKMQKDPNEAVDIFKRPGTKGDEKIDAYRLDVNLLNTNANAELIAEGKESYYERYYLPGLNGEVAHGYNKLIYKNIYNNIDWVLYIDAATSSVKYDFIVHNGGNIADIQLQYNGATQLYIKDGALSAVTPLGIVNEEKPYSYIAGTKQEVQTSFVLNNNVLGFNVGAYNGDLVIDPAVHWITYFGDNALEYSYAAAADTGGYAYLGGHTTSAIGIATTGAFSSTYQGNKDAFIARFNGAGMLQWATYYGGTASDNCFYITTDTLGNLYSAGITASTAGIATSGSVQPTYGGGVSDAYLVKFDNTGARIWATYYGGAGDEALSGSFDDFMVSTVWSRYDNSVYLCGMTTSTTGIATTSSYKTTAGGGQDGYIAKFSSTGARQWATYYGGTGDDKLIKMTASDSGFLYAVGPTTSSSGIATFGVHQSTLGGGNDAFIVKFDYMGSLWWCTYMGGSQNDDPAGIAVDHVGNVYIAGSTQSITGIATTGSYQNAISPGGSTEAYLEKFTPSGYRIWGTYYGGTAPDFTADIAIDKSDNICFVGFTGSSGLATAASYQFTFGGNSDGFIAIFGPSGTRSWVSYIGGTNADNAAAIAYSRTGDLFVAGSTGSMALATNGAYQTTLNGQQDAFLAKFFADTSAYVLLTFSPLSYCAGDSMFVPYGITNPFLPGNTFTVQLSDPVGGFNTPINLTTVSSTVPGVIPCKIPTTVSGPGYRVRIAYTNPAGYGYPNNYNIEIKPLPQKPTITHNSPLCSGKDLIFTGISTTTNATYQWEGPNNFVDTARAQKFSAATTNLSGVYVEHAILQGCIRSDSFTARVDSTPEVPIITSNSPVCMGDTISVSAYSNTGGVNYTWTGPASFTANVQAINIISASKAKIGYYKATAHLGACSTIDSGYVDVVDTYTPTISIAAQPGTNICLGDNIDFIATTSGGGTNPQYKWLLNGVVIPGASTWFWSSTSLVTGDVVSCVFIGNWPCLTRPTDTSNRVSINASGNVAPSVTIKATPGLSVPSGTAITFIATPVNGGNFPRFIFKKNGTTILQDSKSSSYIGVNGKNFKSGDRITCIMISDLICANPDSAYSNEMIIGEDIKPQGISTVKTSAYHVYPNPTSGQLHIEGLIPGAKIQLYDVLGKVVLQAEAVNNTEMLNMASLSSGAYLLHITDKEGNREMIKVVRQ